MNKKIISIILLIMLIAPIPTIPKAKADGASTTEEVWIEFHTGLAGQEPDTDGQNNLDEAMVALYHNSDFNFTDMDIDYFNVTSLTAYVKWDLTNDAFTRDWRVAAYNYTDQDDGGDRIYYEDWELQNVDGDPAVFGSVTRGLVSPWKLVPDEYFFAFGCSGGAGTVRVQKQNPGDADSGSIYDNRLLGGDPFFEWSSYNGQEYCIRIGYWGYKDKLTTFNQYFGDTENYTARRDVNYTFPSGVTNKKYRVTLPIDEALVNITYSNGGLWNQHLTESDYTVEVYNSTHKLITIGNTPLSLYGPAFRIFTQSYNHIYNLYGLFSENGTNTGPITITATRADTSEELDLEGYYLYGSDDAIIMFTWVLSGGETRRYYPIPITENIYVFEPDGTYATYGFDIRDYPGIIGTNVCFLEAVRSVNGTDRVVERNIIWNTHSPVPMILTKNKVYLLRVRLEDGSYYTFGYFTPGDYAPPTLSITGLGWSDYYQPISKWVKMTITRPNSTNIKMVYADNLLITVGVEAKITLRNGTEVWSDYQSENSYTFNWYGADAKTEYVATLTAEHALYGIIDHSVTFMGEIDPDAPPDFSTIGVDPSLLSIFLILAVAGTVSRWNRTAGMFAASAIASLLTVIEWIAIPYELLAAAFALTIISGLGGK